MLRIGRLSLITLVILVVACATQEAEVAREVEEPKEVLVTVEVTREVPITVEVVPEIEETVEAAVAQTAEAWPTHTPIPPPTRTPRSEPTAAPESARTPDHSNPLSGVPDLPKLGNVVEEDGYSLSVVSVEDPARPDKTFYTPTDGTRLVGVEIVVGNTGKESASVNALSATLIDAEGFSHEPFYGALRKHDDIATRDISQGERVKGWVAFEVPDGVAAVYLKYEFEMFGGTVLQAGLTDSEQEIAALAPTDAETPSASVPTPEPTATQEPTDMPTPTKTLEPSSTPTATPSSTPTATPTNTPTATPTNTLTPGPTEETIDSFRESANSDIYYKMVEKSDKYWGEPVCWRGNVFNIDESEGTTFFQAYYFTGKRYNWQKHNDAFVVFYDAELPDVFEDVSVEVCGYIDDKFEGTNAYGATISQPSIYAEYVRKLKK